MKKRQLAGGRHETGVQRHGEENRHFHWGGIIRREGFWKRVHEREYEERGVRRQVSTAGKGTAASVYVHKGLREIDSGFYPLAALMTANDGSCKVVASSSSECASMVPKDDETRLEFAVFNIPFFFISVPNHPGSTAAMCVHGLGWFWKGRMDLRECRTAHRVQWLGAGEVSISI